MPTAEVADMQHIIAKAWMKIYENDIRRTNNAHATRRVGGAQAAVMLVPHPDRASVVVGTHIQPLLSRLGVFVFVNTSYSLPATVITSVAFGRLTLAISILYYSNQFLSTQAICFKRSPSFAGSYLGQPLFRLPVIIVIITGAWLLPVPISDTILFVLLLLSMVASIRSVDKMPAL